MGQLPIEIENPHSSRKNAARWGTRLLRNRIVQLVIVITPLLMGSQCNILKFPGGIRMYTYEAPAEDPNYGIGIGGVSDSGEWISYNYGQGQSQGTQYSFSGVTNFDGIDDYPYAVDNSLWYVAVDFTSATGGICGAGNGTASIPLGGTTVPSVCLLPAQ